MSIEMLNWAFQLPLDSPADKTVLIALANHADPTGDCWPSVARVCLYTSLSERAVRMALRRLEEQGFVTTTHKIGRSSSYKLEGGTTCRGEGQEMPGRGAGDAPKPSYNHQEPKPKKAAAHRLSPDWVPSDEQLEWARQAFPNVEAINETDRFRDYWIGNGKAMVDWGATWRNWIRRASTYQRQRPGNNPTSRTQDNRARLLAALDGDAC